jgi:tripartite-type tricarboxylate transporter receptor subunit TctC
VPTIAESGLPGYEAVTWYGIFTRDGTPRRVDKLNVEVVRALRMPDVARLTRDGSVIVAGSAQAFHEFVISEIEKVRRIARQSGMKLE